jgi:hypothetical protein
MISTVERRSASPAQTIAVLLALLPAGTIDLRSAVLHRAFFELQSLYGGVLPGLAALEFAQRPSTTPVSPQLDQILQILAGSTQSITHSVLYPSHPLWSSPVAPDDVLHDAARALQQCIDRAQLPLPVTLVL